MKQLGDKVRALLLAVLIAPLVTGQMPTAQGAESPLYSEHATLNEAQRIWLRDNPALARIAETTPDRLQEILDRLAAILAHPDATRGSLVPLDDEAASLLLFNPALMEAWRASPEASADLLELIRLAGGGAQRK